MYIPIQGIYIYIYIYIYSYTSSEIKLFSAAQSLVSNKLHQIKDMTFIMGMNNVTMKCTLSTERAE